MNDKTPDKEFWKLADTFVELANRNSETAPRGKVSAAMLFSAARFNTFVVASTVKGKEEFSSRKEEVVEYFTGQFEKMLRDNLGEYETNFAKYVEERG